MRQHKTWRADWWSRDGEAWGTLSVLLSGMRIALSIHKMPKGYKSGMHPHDDSLFMTIVLWGAYDEVLNTRKRARRRTPGTIEFFDFGDQHQVEVNSIFGSVSLVFSIGMRGDA